MPLLDIEVGLSEEERAARDTAHKFAEEVLRPVGTRLDRLADPAQVIAADSPLWEVFERYREIGFDALEAASADRPPEMAARMRALVNEELGWGDAGLAISLGVAGFPALFARLSGRPELVERFASPERPQLGCWAITEPAHGSDTLAFDQPQFRDPAVRPGCIARREGDRYVIQGQKSAWVSNGSIATCAALFCSIEPSHGFEGGGVALVPLDLPGVSRGAPLDKLGQRALNQGELFFDAVRIPAEYLVVGSDAYGAIVETVLAMANAAMGTIFVGVARAALEHALAYARQRVQGGVPIFQHQNVKGRIFRMFTQVEAARSLARRVLVHGASAAPQVQYSIASKVFCTQTAFQVASSALQVYGGNGLCREYPVEKLLRDARASMIEDGCNDLLGLVGAEKL